MRQHVHILMCTLNGAAHLREQLASIAAQDHGDWGLWISDDGSADATRDILGDFAAAHPGRDIRILDGPRAGAARNFLQLLAHPGLPPGPVAFADQDDVWLPDKLSRALAVLGDDPAPAVYCSRSFRTDARLRVIGESPRPARPPGFGNALVQNMVAGNSILLTPGAAAALRAAGPAALAGAGVPFHDWWVYLVMAGIGARIAADDRPMFYYRQHGGNLLGAHRGPGGMLRRLGMMAAGVHAGWIDANLAALTRIEDRLTADNRRLLAAFAALRASPGVGAVRALGALGLGRQSRAGDLALALQALTGRL